MILVVGDTSEARELAGELHAAGVAVASSRAGEPAAWLAEHGVTAVVDATGPFAERVAAAVVAACEQTGVPLLCLERPGWSQRAGDRWRWVVDLDDAAAKIEHGRRVLLTTGVDGLAAFAHRDDCRFVVRCADPPRSPLPAGHEPLVDPGPHTLARELALMDDHGIEIVVTHDSGDPHARATLDAARERGLPVVVVRRPARAQVTTLTSVDGALRWARLHA